MICGRPSCGGDASVAFSAHDLNHRLSGEEFRYSRCDSCGVLTLLNVPSDIGAYYRSDYYDVPTPSRLRHLASRSLFKIDTVRRFKRSGLLLEIGPAFGVFAYQAKAAGFDVEVIEMDERCCTYLSSVVGVNATQSSAPHKVIERMQSHDVIALWHVIEHLPDPWETLRVSAQNLKPGGVLIITAPNPHAFQFNVMRSRWPHLDAPRHLTLIPPEVLISRATELGLERIHYSTKDRDARHWNRFGWQRLLMNHFSSKWPRRLALLVGDLLSVVMLPFETFGNRGSAYTIVFQRRPT